MKVAKDYSHVETIYYKPEIKACPACESRLRRSHRVWDKYIHQLTGTTRVVSMGYRCAFDPCGLDVIYKSAQAESLSLKYHSFGIDVICEIGRLRFSENQTVAGIQRSLKEIVSISERNVEYLIETYMLLVAGVKQSEEYLAEVLSADGIILSIDGIQPEKGNEVLYILRDVLSGEVLCADNLRSSDTPSIQALIEPVIDLGYPILGVISDGQQSIRKAVDQLLPEVAYQLCHDHYLQGIAKDLKDKDSKLKTKLKKEIRDIRRVELSVEKLDEGPEKPVLSTLSQAIRTITLTPSIYPFSCGGICVYNQLSDLHQTVDSLIEIRPHHLLTRLRNIVICYKSYENQYSDVRQLLAVVRRIATFIDPEHFTDDDPHKRESRVIGYLGYLSRLKKQKRHLADSLEHIHKVTLSFLCGLFAYLKCLKLPVTNNDLERFHRQVKTEHRRTTGRRSSHDFVIRYGKFVVYQIGASCRDKIHTVAYSKLKQLKEQLRAIKHKYSQMFRFKHNRDAFLKDLINQWTRAENPQSAPT